MDIVFTVVGIIILGFFVNVLLKQTYNFIFIIAKKPFVWVVTVTVIGVIVWGISRYFGLGVNVPAWASVMALVMNIPPSQGNLQDKESVKKLADEVYAEIGLKHGRFLYRVGLAGFTVSCVGSWLIFYGEVCSGSKCQSIVENVF